MMGAEMKIIRCGLYALAIALAAAPVSSAYSQASSKTVVTSGYFAGKRYTSVTFTAHGNGHYTITYNYTDGTHYTDVADEDQFLVGWHVMNEIGGD